MVDRKTREQEMNSETSQTILDIVVRNFGAKIERTKVSEAKLRCVYDCDCTVVGGGDPLPPFGTAAGVGGYLAGTFF